jgi:hypothetical protein
MRFRTHHVDGIFTKNHPRVSNRVSRANPLKLPSNIIEKVNQDFTMKLSTSNLYLHEKNRSLLESNIPLENRVRIHTAIILLI